jgi:DNA-binding XRE family transcriptional regulator
MVDVMGEGSRERNKSLTGEQREMYRDVGLWLRQMRTKKLMRQVDVGKLVGLDQTTIARIEHGQIAIPLHHFVSLCELFGIKLPSRKIAIGAIKRRIN